MDPWELLDPVDIIKKLPKDLDEQLASKKWQERKAALEAVNGILNENPRLADNPDYAALIRTFTKILGSDSNINCAALAAKNLTGLAKGLRNKFGPFTASVSAVVFEKFKEKRAQLRDPLVELIDAIFATSNLAAISQTILEAAGKSKANPSQKTQLDLFLYRIFRTLPPKEIPKGLLKDFVAVLSEHAFDSDPEVRDSSLAALGAMQKCIGEKALSTFLPANVSNDATKMAKLTEYKTKAETEAAALLASAQSSTPNSAQNQQSAQAGPFETNNHPKAQISANEPQIDPWDLLDPVDIMPKLPNDLHEQLVSKKWQERKTALEAVNGILNENPRLADNPDYAALIKTFTKILGSDANINCAAQAAKNLTGFSKGLRIKFGPHCASVASIVFDKFKEKRAQLREPLIELIDAIFASSNLTALSQTILEAAGKSKANPNQKTQLDLFIYRIFRILSPKDIPKGMLKDLVAILSDHAFDSDPEVRDSSLAAFGAMQKCIGEKALSVFLTTNLTSDATKMAKINEYREKVMAETGSTEPDKSVSVAVQHPPTLPNHSMVTKPPPKQQQSNNKHLRNGNGGAGNAGRKKAPPQPVVLTKRELKCSSSSGSSTLTAGSCATPTAPRSRPISAQAQQPAPIQTHSTTSQGHPSPRPFTSASTAHFHFKFPNTPSGSRIPRLVPVVANPIKFDSSK